MGWTGPAMPTAAPTVVKRKPRALSRGIRVFRAATVWERSPPPSCISRICPACPCGVAFATMRLAPGRCQSSASWVESTVT
jgi:hypothetical protein